MNSPWPAGGPAPRGLYLITPDEADTARLLARVEPLLAEGVTWLQYRHKGADAALRGQQASALQALCARAGVPLIINDDAALALAVNAAGVHLGEDDGDIAASPSNARAPTTWRSARSSPPAARPPRAGPRPRCWPTPPFWACRGWR